MKTALVVGAVALLGYAGYRYYRSKKMMLNTAATNTRPMMDTTQMAAVSLSAPSMSAGGRQALAINNAIRQVWGDNSSTLMR